MNTLLKDLRIVSPDLDLFGVSIAIQDSKITGIYSAGDSLPDAEIVLEGKGLTAMPGFIDIHSHGAEGCDTVDEDGRSIYHIARKKLAEGVTTWLPTTLTLPQDRLLAAAENVAAYMKDQPFAKVPGMHVEGPYINPKFTGAQNPSSVRLPNIAELNELHQVAPILICSLAPEMNGAVEFIAEASELGVRCSAAHTGGTHEDFIHAKAAGLAHMTHFCNQMSGLHHREIGMLGSGLIDPDIKLEIICDGIHVAPDMLRLIFAMKPVEQLMMITDSMAGSWLTDREMELGGLSVLLRDGIARVKETGALAGSTMLYNRGVGLLAELLEMPLDQIVKATSWNQAQSLRLERVGKIEVGYAADIVLLNDNFDVEYTFVDGDLKFSS